MKRNHRLRIIAYLTITFWAVIFLQAPIPQDPAYHQFADQRTLLGIPHCLNVISNLPLLLVGSVGIQRCVPPRYRSLRSRRLCVRPIRWRIRSSSSRWRW